MTTIEVSEQVKIIRKATKAASQSKASARKFLTDAGILKKEASRTGRVRIAGKRVTKVKK